MDSNPDRQALNAQMEAQLARLRGMLTKTIDHIDAREMPKTALEDFRHLRSLEVAGRLTVFLHTPAEELRPVRRAVADNLPEDDEEDGEDEDEDITKRSLEEWRALMRAKLMPYVNGGRGAGSFPSDHDCRNDETAPEVCGGETSPTTDQNPAKDDPQGADDATPAAPAHAGARPGQASLPRPGLPGLPAAFGQPASGLSDSGPRIRSLGPNWPP